MQIRLIEQKDLPKVWELNELAVPNVSSLTTTDLEWFVEESELFAVIEKDNKLVGFMIVMTPGSTYESLNYRYFSGHYSDFYYVDRIVIAEAYRGNGFGSSLYQYLFDRASSGVIACEVNLKPYNEASLEFHKSRGFKQVARQQTENGEKEVSLMVREID